MIEEAASLPNGGAFSRIWFIWTQVWEQIPNLVYLWNYRIFNDTLDTLESTGLWQWLADKINLPDLTIPFDFTLGEIILALGIELIAGITMCIMFLKLLDLLFFFT